VRGYLLDTNVASETRKGRRINATVLAWFESVNDDDLFLSVLVIGEIRKGIEQARSKDPVKARALGGWLLGLEQRYGDRVLPITPAVADQWGRLSAIRPLSTVDGLLAATAMLHDLTLVTRNVTDVAHTGRGLATEAVEFAAHRADELGLHRVEAGTVAHNVGSQRVLLKCGFERVGLARHYLFIAGQWQDHEIYQRVLHDRPA
jgi:hypothetical protein